MVNFENVRKRTWILFFIFVFFMGLSFLPLPYNWLVFLVLSLAALIWTLYLAYVCESFTAYMISLLVTIVGPFSMLACSAAYLTAAKVWGAGSACAVTAGLTPAALTFLTYWIITKGKPTFHPFEYDGIKVQPRSQTKKKKSSSHNLFLVGGVATLGANVFTSMVGHEAAGAVAMVGMVGFCLGYLFYARHIIRGLRILKAQEKNMPVPYTFMDIDSIREARSHWWMSRLFKWAASKIESSAL